MVYVKVSGEGGFVELENAARRAVARATEKGYLRATMKHPLTGFAPGNNIGMNIPYFTYQFVDGDGIEISYAAKGGAVSNVLAMLTKLGKKCAFIGKVGDDIFGRRLKTELDLLTINTDGLKMDNDVRTTLAFVENDEWGDRSFSFYRNPGADIMLTADEVDEELIKSSKVFRFGTLSMTHQPVKSATQKALSVAKREWLHDYF